MNESVGNQEWHAEGDSRWGGLTDTGRLRKDNQDAFIGIPEIGLFLVSDGMGGVQGGKLAAKIVATLLPKMIQARLKRLRSPRPRAIRYWLKYEIRKLSQNVLTRSASEPDLKGMGATLVLALFHRCRLHIAHMGDSRAYLFRDGHLVSLTDDHSVVGFLLREGEITEAEATHHPARGNLTRYVGMQTDVKPDVTTVTPKPHDRILLCSDGLYGMVSETEISAILKALPDPKEACRNLIEAANKAGGKDNVTAVVVDRRAAPTVPTVHHTPDLA